MSSVQADKAVILAAGLGTRMRQAAARGEVSDVQANVAATGLKAMIPIDRPFLDYVLHALADAGWTRLCLVIGPEHDAVRAYYSREVELRRVSIAFAVQHERRGTAHAVLQAEAFVDGAPCLVLNSDNYYPTAALRALRGHDGPATAAFTRRAMVERSNVPAERIAGYAVIEADGQSRLTRIIEKPDAATLAHFGDDAPISMNCWRMPASIFEAARAIEPSPRGELELTDAVQHCIDRFGERFTVLPFDEPVLDLSRQDDIASVADRLRGQRCEL